MTDLLFALVPLWGVWILALATYLSCLALPVPSSFLMLAGGAFAASGDLNLWAVMLGAWLGAVLGDQTGYLIGHYAGRLAPKTKPRKTLLIGRAQRFLTKHGTLAVFLSRWLFSPLGPYVNFLAGAGGLAWPRFTSGSVAGEATWVGIYVALGWAFSTQISTVAEIAGDIVGLLAALMVMLLFARAAMAHHQDHKLRTQN